MTDRQYLKQLLELTVKLTDAVEKDGYRSDAYNEVLKDISVSAARFNRCRRRRHWGSIAIIFVLLLTLGYFLYDCLSLLII